MIETKKNSKLFVHPSQVEEGVDRWSHAEMSEELPWFYVGYYLANDVEKQPLILILMFASQVSELDESGDYIVTEVNLVSPPNLNQTNCWKMHNIQEIWEETSTRNKGRPLDEVYTCIISNDDKLIYPDLSYIDIRNVTGNCRIYPFSNS